MKKKLKKDNILKKFAFVVIIALCLFGLCAGVLTAMENTSKQLQNSSSTVVSEKEIVEFFEEVRTKFNSFKIVY